jgi:ribulose 1,5-bisphosphate synthetase/thiazole synthase
MRPLLAFLSFVAAAWGGCQKFDFVVYGGTAAGVTAAVAAARNGLRVALVAPERHLGGMVTGGLSATDFGD